MRDLIDRQAAIDALAEAMPSLTTPDGCGQFDHDIQVTDEAYVDCMRIIHDLPSAQPDHIGEVTEMVGDVISRQAAIKAICEDGTMFERQGKYTMTMAERKQKDADILDSLPSAQPGWTYIEEELPETIINKHTHDFQEYNCLCDFGDNGFDVRTYKFGNGHFWNGGGIVDKYVTAWQPLPEIPNALKQKPWEGGQE